MDYIDIILYSTLLKSGHSINQCIQITSKNCHSLTFTQIYFSLLPKYIIPFDEADLYTTLGLYR